MASIRPAWWDWELVLSLHLLKRMVERRFSESDLRSMLETAHECRPGPHLGRWVLSTNHDRRRWRVIVEPDEERRRLVVITAYPVE